jgi:hypothetical protein
MWLSEDGVTAVRTPDRESVAEQAAGDPFEASLARKPCANPALELTIVSQTGQFLGRNARDARTAGVRVFLRMGKREAAKLRKRERRPEVLQCGPFAATQQS